MKKRKKSTNELDFSAKEIKKSKSLNDDYKVILSFLIVLLVIAGIVLLFYFFNGNFVTKDHLKNDKEEAEIVFDTSILTVADIFKVKDKHYYVFLNDKQDDLNPLFENIHLYYHNDDIPLYRVDMSDVFNKKYFNKDGIENKNPQSAKEIVITKATLMEIKNGKVVSYITDKEEIFKIFS